MPNRDRYVIKTEIDEAQLDLEQNLNELKDVISDKLDIKGKVNDKIEEGKDRAMDYAVRGREIALDVYAQTRSFVRENPMIVIGIGVGVLVVGGLVLKIRHELNEV